MVSSYLYAFKHMSNYSLQFLSSAVQVESVVNAGPAVYISPSGPNPIMVQVCQMLVCATDSIETSV